MKDSSPATAELWRCNLGQLPAIDFHVHTTYTDGQATVGEVIASAQAKGLVALAITEHVRRRSGWLERFWAEIEQARLVTSGLRVYHGIESKALDFEGTIDAAPEVVERAELVLGSVHRYPDGEGGIRNWRDFASDEAAEVEYRAALGLIRNPQVDVLAHPGGIYEHKFGPFPQPYLEEIVAAAARNGVGIEINARYCRDVAGLLELCCKHDALISLGSDAHTSLEVGLIVTFLRERGLCA